ncbi:uncharacterized protein LOC107806705 isoform X2 [Nicotiana tabacum]|uniref:Uncharacterized protein LOC107806705 isoform X2 n=2 Tax=Nicotiana tabacum TaxID=4097 RepID=A0A1S4BBZ0_TOBAC|nr:PREDICTED: uncharacterized protein LOC107806705 isoform X2 [Nicotiana tabacum]
MSSSPSNSHVHESPCLNLAASTTNGNFQKPPSPIQAESTNHDDYHTVSIPNPAEITSDDEYDTVSVPNQAEITSNVNFQESPSPSLTASSTSKGETPSPNLAANTSNDKSEELLLKCLPLCLAILRGDEHGFDQAAQALAAASSSNSNFHRPRSPNVPNLAASTSRQSPSPNLAANTRSSKTQVLTPYSPAIPRSGRMENLYSLAARTNRSSFEEIGEENINEEKKLWGCLPLYRALLRENQSGFEKEAKALSKFPPDVTICRKVTRAGDTGLHVLVGAGKWYDSVISKPKSYALEGLVIRNNNGHTPLCVAAKVGNMEAAKKLLQLETEIRSVRATDDDTVGRYPIIEAARYGHKEMVLLWIGDMATKMADSPPTKESAASTFLHLLVVAEFYDVLLALVRRFPGLARAEFYGDNDDVSLLSLMAETPSAFRSGTQLGFWQRLLYSVAQANLERRLSDIEKSFVVNQPSVTVPSTESPQPTNELTWECFVKYPRNCVITIQAWLARMINRAIFKHIKDIKLMHKETLDIVKRLCKELMKEYKPKDIEPVLRKAVLLAASSGIPEIIEEIVDCYPDAIWFVNSENHNLFHLAVINRHEKVFNFIYQLSLYKHLVTTDEDTSGNNILHMAGKLAPLGRLNLISGAALQMQRELQWFQEVEKFVHPTLRTNRNSYGKTPKMVFTEEHKELVKEGEKWMKETANSCTFVAALTATVGFAAAITVPGGNQSKGFPIFSKEPAFTIFAVSVAFCLFSSVASVLMFLSILTARYAETDFLRSLPKRLIIGLGTLFISMTSLMIAFGATIYLVFGQKNGLILIPVGIAGLIPVILFESLQFRLLLDMCMSTYGPSIFHKQSSRLLY